MNALASAETQLVIPPSNPPPGRCPPGRQHVWWSPGVSTGLETLRRCTVCDLVQTRVTK